MSVRASARERHAERGGEYADGFRSWVGPYVPVMLGLASRLAPADAEDAVQDALVAAWRGRASFDEAAGSARAWLLMLTAQAAARHQRTRRRRPVLLVPDPPPVADPHAPPDLDLRRAVDWP